MLNGKFYTGLPPKMLERTAGAQNRLESHLFWPDDTHVDTAQESRLKRRSSLQNDSPKILDNTIQRQTSWCNRDNNIERNEIDTKQRFQKEFAKSSITFFDNIHEEDVTDVGNRGLNKFQARKNLKKDITIKPTAMKMQLPKNDTTQDEYAAIKKKQTFSSKIEFFDFVEDGNERRNNKIKPKMDMNDKKEVERHTKNSPKLQVKGIERNLRLVDEQRNNDMERYYDEHDNYDRPNRQNNERILRNQPSRSNMSQSRRYESPIRRNTNYDNDEYDEQNYENYHERRAMPRAQSVPKKILKNPIKDERDYNENYNEDYNGFKSDLDFVERNTRDMRIRNSVPKKHVTYGEEVYEYEANNRYDDNKDRDKRNQMKERDDYREQQKETRMTYNKSSARNGAINAHNTRNELRTINRQVTGNNQRRRNDITQNYELNDEQQGNEQMECEARNSFNYNNKYKNNDRNNIKLNNNQKEQQQQRRNTPKMSLNLKTTSTPTSTTNNDTLTSPISPTMDSQKHLRSSLCFSGGEIVANNQREGTPTSDSNSRHRTARSAATNGRICVGLPD